MLTTYEPTYTHAPTYIHIHTYTHTWTHLKKTGRKWPNPDILQYPTWAGLDTNITFMTGR